MILKLQTEFIGCDVCVHVTERLLGESVLNSSEQKLIDILSPAVFRANDVLKNKIIFVHSIVI